MYRAARIKWYAWNAIIIMRIKQMNVSLDFLDEYPKQRWEDIPAANTNTIALNTCWLKSNQSKNQTEEILKIVHPFRTLNLNIFNE